MHPCPASPDAYDRDTTAPLPIRMRGGLVIALRKAGGKYGFAHATAHVKAGTVSLAIDKG